MNESNERVFINNNNTYTDKLKNTFKERSSSSASSVLAAGLVL